MTRREYEPDAFFDDESQGPVDGWSLWDTAGCGILLGGVLWALLLVVAGVFS